jgi:hypothetical protein
MLCSLVNRYQHFGGGLATIFRSYPEDGGSNKVKACKMSCPWWPFGLPVLFVMAALVRK